MSVRNQFRVLAACSLVLGTALVWPTIAQAYENKQTGMISGALRFEELCFLSILSGGVEDPKLPLSERNQKAQEEGKVRIWWASDSILMQAFDNGKGAFGCSLKPDPVGEKPLPETINEIRENFEDWINKRSDVLGFDIVPPCPTKEKSNGVVSSRVIETRDKNVNGLYVRAVFVELVEFSDFLLIAAESGPERQLCTGGV